MVMVAMLLLLLLMMIMMTMMMMISQNAEEEVEKLKKQLSHINELSGKLAARYCEDEKTFRLEELLSTFHSFCGLVQQCRKVRMKTVELRLGIRRCQQAWIQDSIFQDQDIHSNMHTCIYVYYPTQQNCTN